MKPLPSRRALFAVLCLLPLAVVSTGSTCSPPPTAVTPIGDTFVRGNASETAVAFTGGAGTSLPALTVIAYNQFGGPSFFGWAFSATNGPWTQCNAVTPGCGRGRLDAQVPVPMASATNSYPFDQSTWGGDPRLAAGPNGQVVYVCLGASTNPVEHPPPGTPGPSVGDLIVASVSLDQGQTFGGTVLVNDTLSPDHDDRPDVAADPEGDVFVSWRHMSCASCVAGVQVRAGRFAGGTIAWNDGGHGPDTHLGPIPFVGLAQRGSSPAPSPERRRRSQLGTWRSCGCIRTS